MKQSPIFQVCFFEQKNNFWSTTEVAMIFLEATQYDFVVTC